MEMFQILGLKIQVLSKSQKQIARPLKISKKKMAQWYRDIGYKNPGKRTSSDSE